MSTHTGPVLSLSPAALAALKLPLSTDSARPYILVDANNVAILHVDYYGSNDLDAELAAFIAALLNAALTPDQPQAERDRDREGVTVAERLARR